MTIYKVISHHIGREQIYMPGSLCNSEYLVSLFVCFYLRDSYCCLELFESDIQVYLMIINDFFFLHLLRTELKYLHFEHATNEICFANPFLSYFFSP